MEQKTKYLSVIFLVLYLFIISGCQTNNETVQKEINSKILTADEVAEEIIYSNSKNIIGNTYKFTGIVSSVESETKYVNISTNIKYDDTFNYRFKIHFLEDDPCDKLQESSIITLKADLDFYKKAQRAILMKNGSIIEINNDNVIKSTENVESSVVEVSEDSNSNQDEWYLKTIFDIYNTKKKIFEYEYIVNDFENNIFKKYENVDGYNEIKDIYNFCKEHINEAIELHEQQSRERELEIQKNIESYEKWFLEESSFLEQSKEEYHQELHDFTFILNVDSGVYHLHECSAAKRMKDENKRYVTKTAATQYDARQQVEADGYRVCGICIR